MLPRQCAVRRRNRLRLAVDQKKPRGRSFRRGREQFRRSRAVRKLERLLRAEMKELDTAVRACLACEVKKCVSKQGSRRDEAASSPRWVDRAAKGASEYGEKRADSLEMCRWTISRCHGIAPRMRWVVRQMVRRDDLKQESHRVLTCSSSSRRDLRRSGVVRLVLTRCRRRAPV